ncbi:hypothetical protein FY148_00585 [Agrobacterium tumefaciens]|uniref:hypothetical protein n=1 Tax=Agrobacterium tumefaciens TaxID=358 RepID=UPI0021CF9AAB|nr:hypothetical protein [Agrobacterium tumefaciens]UXS51218.1 hypothetical protein FY148_00585 [Agrobacterium tumefaciens]UXS61465.1 hypothetical protein FY147_00585 [Agrobacterium tumefaciens]
MQIHKVVKRTLVATSLMAAGVFVQILLEPLPTVPPEDIQYTNNLKEIVEALDRIQNLERLVAEIPSLNDQSGTGRNPINRVGLPDLEMALSTLRAADQYGYTVVASNSNEVLVSVPVSRPVDDDKQVQTAKLLQSVKAGQLTKELPNGKVVLTAPKSMMVGDVREVEAQVGVNVDEEKLRQVFREGDQHFERAVGVSHKMRAVLYGSSAFGITNVSEQTQDITEGFPSQWRWSVSANREGAQYLTAVLYAIVSTPTEERQVIVDTFRQDIVVEVRPLSWSDYLQMGVNAVKSSWEALVAVLSIVSGATLLKFIKDWWRRRKLTTTPQGSNPQSETT